jgi:hypothetical protein
MVAQGRSPWPVKNRVKSCISRKGGAGKGEWWRASEEDGRDPRPVSANMQTKILQSQKEKLHKIKSNN